jgi:hypothetical protein
VEPAAARASPALNSRTRYSQHDKTNCESTIRLTMIELNTLKCKLMLLGKHYLEQKNDLIHIPFPSDINKQEFG